MVPPRLRDEAPAEEHEKRVLLTIRDVVGRGAEGHHFWSPKFHKGFVEVKSGKSKMYKAATTVKEVEDFELVFNEELAVTLPEDPTRLIINLCSAGVEHLSRVVARCGIDVDELMATEPIEKYFNLYKVLRDGSCERGGYIHVSIDWCLGEDDEQGSVSTGRGSRDMEVNSTESDRTSLAAQDDGELRTILNEEQMLATSPWISVRLPSPEVRSTFGAEHDKPFALLPSTSTNANMAPWEEDPHHISRPVTTSSTAPLSSSKDRCDGRPSADDEERGGRWRGIDRQPPFCATNLESPRDQQGRPRWDPLDTGGSRPSTSSPRFETRDFLLESLSSVGSCILEMPKLNLMLVHHEAKEGETPEPEGREDFNEGRGAELRGQESLGSETSLSSRMFYQQHPIDHPSPIGADIIQRRNCQEIEISTSEADTDINVLAQQRGLPAWLLLTLTAVGGAAAIALKVLGSKDPNTDDGSLADVPLRSPRDKSEEGQDC